MPGTLHRSPEDLTPEVGWTALTEAVTASAQKLYPTDPKAVALTVANTLQPYMTAFSPGRVGFEKNVSTSGNTPGTPMSKTTEGIILGALTGKRSTEVAKYQHTFPTFPGDACRDDVDL